MNLEKYDCLIYVLYIYINTYIVFIIEIIDIETQIFYFDIMCLNMYIIQYHLDMHNIYASRYSNIILNDYFLEIDTVYTS